MSEISDVRRSRKGRESRRPQRNVDAPQLLARITFDSIDRLRISRVTDALKNIFQDNITISPYKRVCSIDDHDNNDSECNTNDVPSRGFQPDAHVSVILLTAS